MKGPEQQRRRSRPSRRLLHLMPPLALLAACGSTEPARPPYEPNPAPRQAHEVVVTVKDAPEDIYLSSASATYKIANENCMPPVTNLVGVRYGSARRSLPIQLNRIDATTYSGIFYVDGMKNSDYFGRGMCRWRFLQVDASLRTTRTRSFTYFTLAATAETSAETRYARKHITPRLDDGNIYPASDFSEQRFEMEIPAADRGEFFSYSIWIDTRTADQ